jgi:hypothetical protein
VTAVTPVVDVHALLAAVAAFTHAVAEHDNPEIAATRGVVRSVMLCTFDDNTNVVVVPVDELQTYRIRL